jgi:hypothetical protein
VERPARPPEHVTPDLIRQASHDLVLLVDRRLPERFYPRESTWRGPLTALVARMASIVESLAILAEPNLRSLYEHLVTFLWLAIDPEPRVQDWHDDTLLHRRRLHNEAREYGAERVLTEAQLRQAEDAERLRPLAQRAEQADAHWAPRIPGFHVDPQGGPKNVLTMRGMYTVIYRLASRNVHATIESIDPWVELRANGRYAVIRQPRANEFNWSALGIPLFAMGLLVAKERLGWPDDHAVRSINDALMRDDP